LATVEEQTTGQAMTDGKSSAMQDTVDIIIPVYRNLAVTRRCVESVLAHTDMSRARLILVDDASPEPELSAWCRTLEGRDDVLLLRHEQNKGFVASVNLAMNSSNADVVLLNSDTEVPPTWLPRLQHCAYSADDIATVTPFSNNGSICSYPSFCQSSELPAGFDLATMDTLFAEANAGLVTDLPTAVGFCMYIRRECLTRFGLFDEAEFGRGYGEENDFSLRVAAAGWRNCLCADLFVYHQGAVSFGDDRHVLMGTAEGKLAMRYPDYALQVGTFIAHDRLRPFRDAVDSVRARQPGQWPALLQEARRHRDWLLDHLQLRDRLLNETRNAYRQQQQDYEARCQTYEGLLSDTRAENQKVNDALGGLQNEFVALQKEQQQSIENLQQQNVTLEQRSSALQQEADALRQEIARLQNLRIMRLGRWIKRNILRQ